MTSSDTTITKISQNMRKLLEELQHQVGLTIAHEYQSSELMMKIYYQGEDDGLSKDDIRSLVVSTLKAVKGLKDRQIRNILPPELKYIQFANKSREGIGGNIAASDTTKINSPIVESNNKEEVQHSEDSTAVATSATVEPIFTVEESTITEGKEPPTPELSIQTIEKEYELSLTKDEIENILNLMEIQAGKVFSSAIDKFREIRGLIKP
ncbi:MAG TPA: hypothetical protein VEL70_08125 [Candidatus Acidoferrum sp.]|nr:hypothetical protein [Candidatus Acidoferrum sp.]